MKTRQQRLAEERAGDPSSPPQQLAVKTRGPRRTRAKKPIVGNASVSSPAPAAGSGQVPGSVLNQLSSVEAGPVAPTTQLAVPGEARALLRLWEKSVRKQWLLDGLSVVLLKKGSNGCVRSLVSS